MNLLAIVGSPRKRKSTDTLTDKAIEGFQSEHPDCEEKKIHLADYNLHHCRNCLTCMKSNDAGPYVRCVIHDGMDDLYEDIVASDALLFGTPVHMGYATALMTQFMERICWTFSKAEKSYLVVKGCPQPRSEKKRTAAIIVTTGIIPPLFRSFCDQATPFIKGAAADSLNATTVGSLYAGDIDHRGVDYYHKAALKLGKKLARKTA
jgi:FMN-dependent NADH-azoreductase